MLAWMVSGPVLLDTVAPRLELPGSDKWRDATHRLQVSHQRHAIGFKNHGRRIDVVIR
jgi:hypothetical protein